MNLGESSIVLRHRPALEVVDLALIFVRNLAPKQFLKLSGIFLLPAWGLCMAGRWAKFEWWTIWLGALLLIRLLEIPFTVLCGKLLFEPDTNFRSVVRDSRLTFFRTAWALFLYAILMVLSAVLVVGPLFVGANYFFLPEVMVLEKSAPLGGFKRSQKFLGGKSGTGVEAFLLRTLMLVCFVVLAETLGQALVVHLLDVNTPLESLWEDGGSPFALFGLFAFVPYASAHRFLAYTNERTRQDGWDIQVAFLRLAAGAGPALSKDTARAT